MMKNPSEKNNCINAKRIKSIRMNICLIFCIKPFLFLVSPSKKLATTNGAIAYTKQ
jgi:hypothetical protein